MIYSAILEIIVISGSKCSIYFTDTSKDSNQLRWTSGEELVECLSSSALEMKALGGEFVSTKEPETL